jgi:hypothetical protein
MTAVLPIGYVTILEAFYLGRVDCDVDESDYGHDVLGSLSDSSITITLWHFDAESGRRPLHQKLKL